MPIRYLPHTRFARANRKGGGIPHLSRNTDIVEAGGYKDIITTGGSALGGTNSFHTLNYSHDSRVRQNGSITKVQWYLFALEAEFDKLTSMKLMIWRKDGTTYDLVGSQEILPLITWARAVHTIELPTPIVCERGDYIGWSFEGAGSPQQQTYRSSGIASESMYWTNATPTTPNFDWESKSLVNLSTIYTKVFMQAPLISGIGDSVMQGAIRNRSFITVDDITQTNHEFLYWLKQTNVNYFYQNLGQGSDTTTKILAHFNDMTDSKSRLGILQGGLNDLGAAAIPQATTIQNFTDMLDLCVANDIIPLLFLITPWTNATTQQAQDRDALNVLLTSLGATYTTSILVEFQTDMGLFRAGGDAGNLWDIQVAYDDDGVHMNVAGYTKMAEIINAAIIEKYNI